MVYKHAKVSYVSPRCQGLRERTESYGSRSESDKYVRICLFILINRYDVSHKVYVIKAVKHGIQHNILLESGVRFVLNGCIMTRIHSTNFVRDKSRFPSGFSQKMRKYIRNRRIEAVRQIGFVGLYITSLCRTEWLILFLEMEKRPTMSSWNFMLEEISS